MGVFAGCITLIRTHLNHYDLARAKKNAIVSLIASAGLYVIAVVVLNPLPEDKLFWGTIALFLLLLIFSIVASFVAAIILKFYRRPITEAKLRYARLLRLVADHLEETTVEPETNQHEQRQVNTITEVLTEHADKIALLLL